MFKIIPLNTLTKSIKNVRKVKPSESAFNELKASIETQGLLQNLVVEASPTREGWYEVIAGGRRLEALQELQAEEKLPEDYGVACKITKDHQVSKSLAENIIREAMHPADQLEIWGKLVADGETAADIALRFGVEEALIHRRLKLCKLAPEIIEGFREGKIDLARLMALTLSDDHPQQIAIYERFLEQSYSFTPQTIRQTITEDRVSSKMRIAVFVGVEAYEEAGGIILRDLFEEDMFYFEDAALLDKLAEEKLADTAADLLAEGWKWTDVMKETDYNSFSPFDNIYASPINAPQEMTYELTQLEERRSELGDLEEEDWTDELLEEARKIASRCSELKEIIESHKEFSAEEKARSGCIVSIDYNGETQITNGLIHPDDQEMASETEDTAEATDHSETEEEATFKLGKQLAIDLTSHRLQITKSYLCSDFDLTFDLAVFSLCQTVFRPHSYSVSKPLNLTLGITAEISSRDDLDGTSASERRADVQDKFDLSWLNDKTSFVSFCALEIEEKQQIFAYCIAQGLHGQLSDKRANPILETVGRRLDIDIANDWRPTAENFWGRVTKAHALSLASDVVGAEWALTHSKDKKSVLSPRLEQIFSGEMAAGFPVQVQDAARRWVPEFMAYSDPDDFADEKDIIPEEAEVAEEASSEDSSEDFFKDHIQVIHIGDQPQEKEDSDVLNGQKEKAEEELPAFLQGHG